MKFSNQLIKATFLRRYKRFLADVVLASGETVVAHCPNTGSMRHCMVEGSECWVSRSTNPKRKLGYTLEVITAEFGGMAGINTARANAIVYQALLDKRITELHEFHHIAKEVYFEQSRTRFDFKLLDDSENVLWLEVKNLTMAVGGGLGMFPDAVTERGQKHLRTLMDAKASGARAMLLFCVQHTHIDRITTADTVDPAYAALLLEAIDSGVEVLAYRVNMSRDAFSIDKSLPIVFGNDVNTIS